MDKKILNIIGIVLIRLIAFIPFALLVLISTAILFLKYMINFVLYGGEAIAYVHKNENETIAKAVRNLIKTTT